MQIRRAILSLAAGILLVPFTGFSQLNESQVIDTIETDKGPVILYKDFSWEYLGDEPVMLSMEDDSTGLMSEGWNTEQIFGFRRMSADSVKDTVLMLASADHEFKMPLRGKLLRGFMYTHKGLDIRANTGDSVSASFDGVVRYAQYNRGGFGYLVIIRHYNGLETYYAHLSKIKVKVNQVVNAGDLVGLAGSTGRSRGPHLHFEVRYKDVALDPLRLIDFDYGKLLAANFQVSKKIFFPNDHDVNAVYHKIRKGDTLGTIARKYHTSVKEICARNKIRTSTTLRVGKTLRVR